MRDKLIELLCAFDGIYPSKCSFPTGDCKPCEKLADFLIAHGITFATDNNVTYKWIPVSERLPERTGRYLVHHKGGFIAERYFYEEAPERFVPYLNEPITHWMPLPKAPKEGE